MRIGLKSQTGLHYAVVLVVGALIYAAGFFSSFWFFTQKQQKEDQTRIEAIQNFTYGIKECSLTVSDIEWNDYPGWKNLSFQVSGAVTVWAPQGAEVQFADLNPDSLQEKSRESRVLSEIEKVYYDVISYEIEQGTVEGRVTETRKSNPVLKAVNGYQWKISWETDNPLITEYIVGCILPMDDEMQFWSDTENHYAGRNLEAYLDAFQLSRTYQNGNVTEVIDQAEGISLIKYEKNIFCYKMINEGIQTWYYLSQLPDLEMWYDGIWLEVKCPYGRDSGKDHILAGEERIYDKPDEDVREYPYLMPGLYRLVVYEGYEDDERSCAVSNVFEIGTDY